MSNRVRCLLFIIYCLPLSACDLYPKIMGKPSMPADEVAYGAVAVQNDEPAQYGTNAAAQYGASADGGQLYAGPDIQYASAGDYNAPKVIETPPSIPQPPQQINQQQPHEVPHSPPSSALRDDTSIDDTLLVPARIAAAPAKVTMVAPPSGEITVEKGDTVYSIAQKYDVQLRDLLDANTLSAPYTISVGQKLRLPSARYHTVMAGETLYSISRMYSVDLNSLVRENRLTEPYGLYAGQKLKLPAKLAVSGDQMAAAQNSSPVVTPPSVTPAVASDAAKPAVTTTNTKPAAQPTAPSITSTPKTGTAANDVKKLPAAAARTSTKFSWPVTGKIISNFGAKSNGLYNDGINIGAPLGTPVKAAENGVVAYAGNELKGMGNLVIIQHSGGWMTVYAHMDSMTVKRGARVAVGEKIGTVGSTGKVSEPQLHFEIRNGTKAYNPTTQLKK